MQPNDKPEERKQAKKPYESPALQVYGTIEKMTLNIGPKGALDGGGGAAAGPKTAQ